MSYFFYILRCADNSLYCGITNNPDKRLKEHNSDSARGSKYVRARRPVTMVYHEEFPDIQTAMARERQVKKWRKSEKESLVAS
ncbi:GIY-YIG nuclease family protein [Candidatus Microgenomates bacterium]|nr:GIY-YIG nuclease family protein [Candidatus Microgenomates bacterium]